MNCRILFCTILLLIVDRCQSQSIYNWIGPNAGAWTTSTNWSPARYSQSTSDILVFNNVGTTVVKLRPFDAPVASTTIGKLVISGNSSLTIQGDGLFINGSSSTQLQIDQGSYLELHTELEINPSAVSIVLVNGTFCNRTYCTINENVIFEVNGTLITNSFIWGNGSLAIKTGAKYETSIDEGIPGFLRELKVRVFSDSATYILTRRGVTGSELPRNVENLIIKSGDVFTLSRSTNIFGKLEVQGSQTVAILLGTNDLRIDSTASVIWDSSKIKISTNSTGSLIRFASKHSGDVFYPISPLAQFSPITINNDGISDYYSVRVMETTNNTIDPHGVVKRQWIIKESVPGGSNIILKLQFRQEDVVGAFNSSNAVIGRYSGFGVNWDLLPSGTITGLDPFEIQNVIPISGSGVFDTSIYTIGNPSALSEEPFLPEAPTASTATVVASNSFNANWSKATNATGYFLDVATDNGFINMVSGYNSVDVGNVLYHLITGLDASSHYYYRVRAYNLDGVSGNSNTIAVITLPTQFTMTLIASPIGSGDISQSGSGVYNPGSSVVLTAIPNNGYSFTGWSSDATGSTNPLTITMDANKTITANFELDQNNPVVKINLMAILQGCYNANLDQMSMLLNTGSFLPQISPYCEDQCSVGSIPIDVTDWVLVQLFNSVSDAPLVSKSAFLRRDGCLVDTDGNIGIIVNAHPGNYFVGLVHRNHLTVKTSSAITLTTNEGILYDFTTGADKCYGGNGSVEVEPGIWGMWAGDINQDGNITTKDYTIWFEADRRDLAGYQPSDVNGDTNVDDLDYSIWLSNAQKGPNSTAPLYSECYIVTDIDGNAYNTVKIGGQVWITENLKVTHYRNGDNIPNVTDASEWATLATGAYCNSNNDAGNIATYGRLYNWYSVNDPRGLAPEGWHIPNDGEWQVLVDYLGGNAIAGGKIKESGTFHWASPNTGATDDYGFCAVPNGYRNFDGIFYDMGISALFWTSTAYNSGNSLGWYPRYEYANIFRDHHPIRNGFAIRCVKD